MVGTQGICGVGHLFIPEGCAPVVEVFRIQLFHMYIEYNKEFRDFKVLLPK